MKKVLIIFAFLPLIISAQEDSGLKFESGRTWQQVKEKAKAENKYIFVDCYATWCGPCKQMDREVFSKSEVADQINKDFIAVKIQMDKTDLDKEDIKRWYNDAKVIQNTYTITAFPTYLF